jgi:hypothetical protein
MIKIRKPAGIVGALSFVAADCDNKIIKAIKFMPAVYEGAMA